MLLFVALSVILLLMWQSWQQDYGPKPPASTPVQSATPNVLSVPTMESTAGDVPAVPTATSPTSTASSVPSADPKPSSQGRIRVVTDVYDLVIDTKGGDIKQLDLRTYPVSTDQPDVPFRLLTDSAEVFFTQTGLISSGSEAPDHHAEFSAEKLEYRLAAGEEEIRVPLTWQGSDGLVVQKIYTFRRGSFIVGFEQIVKNGSAADWTGRQYRQLQRARSTEGNYWSGYTYTGSVYYSPETKYEKVAFDDIQKETLSADFAHGWAAITQHYFLGAWVPNKSEVNHYYTKALPGDRFIIGLVAPVVTIPASTESQLTSTLYVGPKIQSTLAEVAPGLDLTVDYGLLTIISQPLFWALEWIHSLAGNWGWAIIILTLLIKLAFYKLSETSYRSMANMRKMQPRIQALRDRYGDDKQRLNQAMMEIYKKEKINPLGGCLPILVQIPVFIALYWMLLESVELRQAPFMFWINDLSIKDPFYVLPILMGASMFVQQRLNPTPPDPIQAKIMMALPFVFTVMFLWFPSGLVLYWLVNNILSIAQQWHITRRIEKAA